MTLTLKYNQIGRKQGMKEILFPLLCLFRHTENEKTNTRKKERGNTMKNVCYGVAFAAMLIAVNAIVLASMMGFNNLMEVVQVI